MFVAKDLSIKEIIFVLEYLKHENLCGLSLQPQIVDFGFSAMLDQCGDGSGTVTVLGTEGYMAPEIYAKQPYDGKQVDLFAAGMTFFIMFSSPK
jgi:serine/threonine protein kinase